MRAGAHRRLVEESACLQAEGKNQQKENASGAQGAKVNRLRMVQRLQEKGPETADRKEKERRKNGCERSLEVGRQGIERCQSDILYFLCATAARGVYMF